MERREFLKKSALAALGTAVAGTGLVQAFQPHKRYRHPVLALHRLPCRYQGVAHHQRRIYKVIL